MRLTLKKLIPIAFLLTMLAGGAALAAGNAGAVYVASNAPDGNAILIFQRSANGALHASGSIATGGNGTGAGLGNQGGLVISENERYLYVVNAASDSVSALAVDSGGLRLIGTYPSGGVRPVSIALDRRLLYVVHAGGTAGAEDGVSGFRIRPDGALDAIPNSFRSLSAPATGPAQGGFSSDGQFLLVTEKATNTITVFPVGDDGRLGPGQPQPSVGETPFGFDVGRLGRIFVTEAFGGAVDSSTVTAYDIDAGGNLIVIDPSVPTTETAACWFAVSNDGRFGYTTNTGSATLSGFRIRHDGRLRLLDADGVTGISGAGPIDLDFSRDGRYLYALDAGSAAVTAFRVRGGNGSLTTIGQVEGLPAGANGLAAR